MESPNAHWSSVDEIIKTFKGYECPLVGPHHEMWYTFDDRGSFDSALHLINMLKGFKAEPHCDIKNTIKIFEA